MRRLLLLFFCVLFCASYCYGQVQLKGTVTDSADGNVSVSLATIYMCDASENGTVITSSISEEDGSYALLAQAPGRYAIIIESLGYETLNDTIQLRDESGNGVMIRNYSLMATSEEIDGVVVKGKSVQHYIDHTEYTVTRNDVRAAVDVMDLMQRKVLQLNVDQMSQKLTSVNGAVRVYINGVSASEYELKTLSPTQIDKIEYYDVPPAKYGGTGIVVNVITKNIVRGFYGGIDLRHAVTVGFFDDAVYLKYNWGKGQVSLNYSASYRNYRNAVDVSEYDYYLGGVHYNRKQESLRKFGYLSNYFNLAYMVQDDKYTLQINFYPTSFSSWAGITSDVSLKEDDVMSSYRRGVSNSETPQFTPSLNVYYWRKLSENDEIIANLVGSYFDARNQYDNAEFDNMDLEVPVFEDFQDIVNRKYSVIGQGVYTRKFSRMSLSFSERISYEHLGSQVDNSFGSTYSVTGVIGNHLSGELLGSFGKRWQYRVALGVATTYTDGDTERVNWVFTPNVMLGCNVTDRFMLRASFSQYNTSPSLGQQNKSITYISDNIIARNNPDLVDGFANATNLMAQYDTSWGAIAANIGYSYSKNPVNAFFVEGDEYMELVYENSNNAQSAAAILSIEVSPFKNNLLAFGVYGGVTYDYCNSPQIGVDTYWSFPLSFSVQFRWKEFWASYQGNITSYTLDAPYLVSNERNSTIAVGWNHKNFGVNLACFFFLIDGPMYSKKTVAGSPVMYRSTTIIHDNINMVTLGMSYRFGNGNVFNEKARRINNSDNDAGL